ncbi:hypothetical protein [Corynebacterium pseudodiphtheriticum]|uniref:hypothetical protein n=1 Tax=Corynebacterium pseudodiphtheriticum TaxID=37637 RepID=UPI0012930672|nr:hypothetical protein [Corynebacterium pseudodiphtheriticum]MDK4318423.1 hypothetical protein [Corynebacterium pseudodiphtheriticum]
MSKKNLFSDVVMATAPISAREVKANPNDSGLAFRGCTSNKWVQWGFERHVMELALV